MDHKILFVDDEKLVLSALKDLFIADNYAIFTAENGHDALNLLKKEPVDLIISDQRLRGIKGVELLRRSKEFAPDSVRIIVAGHTNIDVAIDSINKGEIYRYITKPWDNYELKAIVRDALKFVKFKKENARLLELTAKQNLELKEFNEKLQEDVNTLTKDKDQIQFKVAKLNDELNNQVTENIELKKDLDLSSLETAEPNLCINESIEDVVTILSNILRLKENRINILHDNMPKLVKLVAKKMKMSNPEIREIETVSKIYDLGFLGINDSLLKKSLTNMTSEEKVTFRKHPVLGQMIIEPVKDLQHLGIIVRHHHENWDGTGYPDGLIGENIPMGARIIKIVNDYNAIKNGLFVQSKCSVSAAIQLIIEKSGHRYDPEVVKVFVRILKLTGEESGKKPTDHKVRSSELKDKMVLSKPIYSGKGMMLLDEGSNLTNKSINTIVHFEEAEGEKYDIYVLH